MMWTELTSFEEAPKLEFKYPLEAKRDLLEASEYLWLVSRDDKTPVLIAGLYRPQITLSARFVWFIPYRGILPRDWRGMKKLFLRVTAKLPDLYAYVDVSHGEAIRVVEHLGMKKVATYDIGQELYKWHSQH